MKTLFQKFGTQIPNIFYKEPPKKLPKQDPQKWNQIKKTALAIVATFITGTSYLTYRHSFQQINLPDSPISNPINTALKIMGSITALAGLVGLVKYSAANQSNILQKQKSNAKTEDTNSSEEKNKNLEITFNENNFQITPKEIPTDPDEERDCTSPKTTELQTTNENQNTEETSDTLSHESKQNSTNFDCVKQFNDFHAGEKIDKDHLEELITKYIDQYQTSPESTISNIKFFEMFKNLIWNYETIFVDPNENIDQKKSVLRKIIDIWDVLTGRTDSLSDQLIGHLISDCGVAAALRQMTLTTPQEDSKNDKELIELSCQLIYRTLNQQLKILYCDDIVFQANDILTRILDLLTPYENDVLRLKPDFYKNFIQQSPKLAWSFVQNYIFEHMTKHPRLPNIGLSADLIITDILNFRNENINGDIFFTNKDGLDILKKIVIGAKLSLFLNDTDAGAASFAIRLMQHKLKIDPEEFEKNSPNDKQPLKELYFNLCRIQKLRDFNIFKQENTFKNQTFFIAKELINECRTTFLVKRLFGADETQFHQSFLNRIGPLSQEKELSKKEKNIIQHFSLFIRSQILDPSIPQRAELAFFALNKYPSLFQDEASISLIKKAYDKSQPIENPNLDSACQNFLKSLSDIDSDAEMKQKENYKNLPYIGAVFNATTPVINNYYLTQLISYLKKPK